MKPPRGKLLVSLVNSHTNTTSIGGQLWEIDLRIAHGLPPGRFRVKVITSGDPPPGANPPPIKADRMDSRVQGANRHIRHASRRKALPAAPRPEKGQPPSPPVFPCSTRHLRREFLVCAAFQRATIPPYPAHRYQLTPVRSISFAPRALAPESTPCADLAALNPCDRTLIGWPRPRELRLADLSPCVLSVPAPFHPHTAAPQSTPPRTPPGRKLRTPVHHIQNLSRSHDSFTSTPRANPLEDAPLCPWELHPFVRGRLAGANLPSMNTSPTYCITCLESSGSGHLASPGSKNPICATLLQHSTLFTNTPLLFLLCSIHPPQPPHHPTTPTIRRISLEPIPHKRVPQCILNPP